MKERAAGLKTGHSTDGWRRHTLPSPTHGLSPVSPCPGEQAKLGRKPDETGMRA